MSTSIALARLTPSPSNPRVGVGPMDEFETLCASIEAHGIIQPLVVTPSGGGEYEIIAGARRFAAAQKLGLREVACEVRELTDGEREAIELMLIENLQRRGLDPIEEAHGFQRLVDLGVQQTTVAARVGRSDSYISERRALLRLPIEVQDRVSRREISQAHAVELVKLAEHPDRLTRAMENSAYQDITAAVAVEVGELKRDRTRAELIAITRMGPVPYVELVEGPHGTLELPAGVAWLNTEHPNLGIPTKRHEASGCHAVTIDRFGNRAFVCTSPTRHPTPSSTPSISPEEQARRDELAAQTAATNARRGFVANLVQSRIPRVEALDLIVSEIVRTSDVAVCELACEFLDLVVPEDSDAWEADLRATLGSRAGENENARAAVGLALMLAGAEQEAGFAYGGWEDLGSYFAALGRHGYQPSDAERRRLNGGAE